MTLPTVAEFGQELLALDNDSYIPLKITPLEGWAILAQIQLALRCPGNKGPTADLARAVALYLQRMIATTPALVAVAEAGWNTDYDEEVEP